ncbi:unnamed protein product [Calypogeia fissa]
MERLKASIPENLRALIVSTPFNDLQISTGALADHFSTSPQFSQLLEQLTNSSLTVCAKDAEGAAACKRDGNAAFGSQNYGQALSCYTKALRYAPVDSKEEDSRKAQAVLFINRAAALHKLGLLEPAIRDCDRAIDAQPSYSKAWYRRSLLKCDMRDYAGAVIDMEQALATETTSGGRLQIKRELAQMELRNVSVNDPENISLNSPSPNFTTNRSGMEALEKHWTKEKGWSLQTKEDLPSGSLVFQEDPYAAVVLKSARDTHCHFCFEKLPADPVPCSGCAIPLYCSELCRNTARSCLGGHDSKYLTKGKLSLKLLELGNPPASSVNCKLNSGGNLECPSQRWGEHIPECGGASWSAVLPTDAVLGARMLFRTICMDDGLPTRNVSLSGVAEESEVDTLCHHYDKLHANDKLELHVLGTVLAQCVDQCTAPLLEAGSSATVASKVILLIAQVRVNAMVIHSMVSSELGDNMGDRNYIKTGNEIKWTSASVCTVEQVRVAQGIFLVGSRLNHSCIPNIHSSFASGRLFIRAITNITRGSTLELCYGPQVGELNQLERKQALSEEYFFDCDCPGCSKLTLPDLLLRAFQCTKPGCNGVVLGPQSLESKFSQNTDSNSTTHMVVGEHQKVEISVPAEGKESKQKRQHSMVAIDVNNVDKKFSKASLVWEENIGSCLCCGTVVDVKTGTEVSRKASAYLERVEADLNKAESHGRDGKRGLKGALNAMKSLRATLHAHNQQLAKGEDIVAQLLCDLDQPLKALEHCKRSIETLEQLYNKEHIVIGNEYVKLASVALMASDRECARQSIAIADKIFTVHYGSDYASRLPYLVHFQELVKQR